MATLATEMPPLHTAEVLAGVTAPVSSQNTSGGGPGASGGNNNPGIDSTQSPEADTANSTASSINNSQSNSNNTISAAADSSDNQPGTPQPHLSNVNESAQNSSAAHHPYANHHIYANSQPPTTTAANTHLNQMYAQHIYSQSNMDLQQQQQQQQQQQHSSYPSYLNSYEQFYQQQQQQQQQQNPTQSSSQTQNSQQMDFINSNSNSMYSGSEYKQLAGVRYHPYLHTPTSGIPSLNSQNSNSNNALDANSQTAPVVSSASSSLMSPRVVSSTSPSSSSNQMQISGRASSIGSMSAGNPNSPNSAGSLQCKKCGIMCTNESELQEHITNVHGASPYGSSGYASSPYIKEEMQQQTPPSQSQQQQQSNAQQPPVQGGNPGEILDLDSQKMLYPPTPGSMVAMMNPSLGNSDPLHGLHSMQQRAGINNTWDQQAQEGLPPFLQQQQQQTTESKILPNHSPYYQSPKQSPYHVSNSSNVIKAEYQHQPIIKTEYTGDTQQYMDDKSFDPTAPNQQQQQMMPPAVSSSPAEFPSTTTGGPQDNGQQNVVANQQFRAGNFEPPSSSSATLSTGAVGSKAASWKSNEARRPKTYNCTACNKWFTSSGHLKRHYNTTLHKNAVKSSGQPDPATLPISVHHHPARDPSGKAGRRGAAAAAAAAAAANATNISAQQQQQPPNPVQPPEPPNSPQDYGGAPVAAGGLTPLTHYAATPSPNSMYQQQQYQQHQYMPQVQSTTNASPQHASTMVNHHLQQHQHQNQQQTQQAVMNGHPNALAGLSVPPTRQQTPMPSSQMRGLLNKTMPSSTATTTTMHIIKNEHLEAATIEEQMDHDEEVEELGYLTTAEVKQEYLEETEEEEEVRNNVYSPKADMESVQGEELSKEKLEQESELALQHQRLSEVEQQAVGVLREVDHNVVHHRNSSQLPTLRQLQHFRLEQQQQQYPADMERLYHNTTPSSTHSNMPLHSPLIISHQQYQEQLQQQHQMLTQGTYTLTQTPPLQPQQLQHNTMEHQHYINMPLAINTQQQPSNMLQLQPPLTTEQQLPPDTTIPITNMGNMLPPNHHHMQQPQQQHTELQPLANTQLQPDTINTNIPSHITTTSNITNIPSYHHLQQPGSVLPPLDPTLTYPHTIIGNAEVLTLDAYGNLVSASGQHHQVIQTADGQLVQLISTGSTAATSLYSSQSYCPYIAQRSPQEGDLPPMTQHCQQEPTTTTTLTVMPSSMSYSPSQGNSNSSEYEYKPPKNEDYLNSNFNEEPQQLQIDAKNINNETTTVTTSGTGLNKRKRNPSTSSSIGANSTMLPSGRIKCLPCDKEFTKICYLTQHNKSFHSGEYPFRCQKCGKRYQSEDVYITHLGKHKTTDKAHKCEICPKQFHHKTDLRRHVEAIHTGNKQHSCDVCEKSFCRKDHLRKHMETHNRPRVAAKKITSRGSNNNNNNTNSSSCSSSSRVSGSLRITKAFSTVYKKSKDLTSEGNSTTTIKTTETNEKSLSNSSPGILIGNQLNSSLPAVSAVHLNETNSLSSATTSTPSPLMQQIDDVAADDDELLEDDLDEYDDGQDMEENEDFNMPQYEQHVVQSSAQYNLGSKNQVYQIVEQELPMY